jgi:hypothetical protein
LTLTRRANLHAHDFLTHTLSDDDLHETPGTASRHHLSCQRSSSFAALPMAMSCRPLHVAPLNTITHRLADDGVLAIFTRSLRRPTIARPEALARVASPGQAQLQIFDLALIPIVGIRPQIDQMKLDKHTRRLLFYRQACVSHALNFFSFFLVFSFFQCYGITKLASVVCIYTRLENSTDSRLS